MIDKLPKDPSALPWPRHIFVKTLYQFALGAQETAQKIEDGTPQIVAQIRSEIEKLPTKTNADIIVKKALERNLQFLEFDLLEYFSDTRSRAGIAVKFIEDNYKNVIAE